MSENGLTKPVKHLLPPEVDVYTHTNFSSYLQREL